MLVNLWLHFFFPICCAVFRLRRKQGHPTLALLPGKSHGRRSLVGCSPWGCEESDTTERLHFHFYALEKEIATHSSVLAWRIPGVGEPGGLPSMGSHRVGHDWSDLAAAAAAFRLNLKQVSISIICKLTLISLHDIVISADLCVIMNSLAGQTFLSVSESISWLMVRF